MAVDWSAFQSMADDLIGDVGRSVTLVKVLRAADDTDKPWRGPAESSVSSSLSATAVFFGDVENDAPHGTTRSGRVESVLVASEDLNGSDLSTYDYLNDGGNLRRIVEALELKPGSTSVLWGLKLEK